MRSTSPLFGGLRRSAADLRISSSGMAAILCVDLVLAQDCERAGWLTLRALNRRRGRPTCRFKTGTAPADGRLRRRLHVMFQASPLAGRRAPRIGTETMTQANGTLRKIDLQPLLMCGVDASVAEAARKMAEAHCSSILIEDQGRIVGIWTERDALALDVSLPASGRSPISMWMTHPVKTIHIDTSMGEAALRFRRENIRHFLIVDDLNAPKGVLSQSDVVNSQRVEYYISLRELKSVFSRKLLVLPGSMLAPEAIKRMRQEGFDAVVVEDGQQGLGIVTERDVVRLIGSGQPIRTVGELAVFPLISISADSSLYQARKRFSEKRVRHLGVVDDDGTLQGLISFADILADIESQYVSELEDALKERDERLARHSLLAAKVFETTFDAIFITNAEQLIESVNPAFTMITGFEAHEVIGKKPSILSSGRHDSAFYQVLYKALEREGHWQGEIWNKRKSGEIFPEWITINVVKDGAGKVLNYVAVFSDITHRKAVEQRLTFLAQHDALTSLPNRVLLEDRLLHAMTRTRRNQKKLAVMFLDLDDFKKINDSFGHHAGDQLLQIVAQRLVACVRAEDTVARLGGDEFVVLLEDIGAKDDVALVAGKLLDALTQPMMLEGRQVNVASSMGISLFPGDGEVADDLIRHADLAMYSAKMQASAGYCFYDAQQHGLGPKS
jgi:diguanylate cyclase (GGDEF)-like protein/PAS domain S-box-containing protein